jgi:hypothetical protein
MLKYNVLNVRIEIMESPTLSECHFADFIRRFLTYFQKYGVDIVKELKIQTIVQIFRENDIEP